MKRFLVALCLVSGTISPAFAAKKKPEPVVVAPPPPPPDPEAWRASPPAVMPERPWVPPTAESFTLSNGIPVYLVQNPALPLVSIDLVMTVGREANPAGKAGLAMLTASMLDESTTTRSGSQIAAEVAMAGATLSISQYDEAAVVAMDALTGETLGPSLDLLADVVLHPKFDKSDYSQVQSQTLTAIQKARSEPRDVVSRVFSSQLYGANHPYGIPSIGSEESVKADTLSDVKKFYASWWHSKNAAFLVCGATTEAELKPLLEARFGGWKAGKSSRPAVAAPATPIKTRVVFVEQPGAVQTVLRVGTVGVSRTSSEYFPAQVEGNLFGGMFSSRLNMSLREEHGWSYGAYGGFSDNRDYGTFAARTSVQADKTAPAVTAILAELAAAAAHNPSDADLKMSKDSMLKSLPGNFANNSATAGAFAGIPQFGLKPDLWRGYLAGIDGVSADQAGAAAKRYFDASHLLIVAVGPRSVTVDDGKGGKVTVDVVAELKALGFEYVDATPATATPAGSRPAQ